MKANKYIIGIRNIIHIIAGLTLLYCIGNYTGVHSDFDLSDKIIWIIFAGTIGGIGAGVTYEFFMHVAFGNPIDKKDIRNTAIGGILGCIIACIYKDITFITTWLFWGCIALLVADTIRAIINKNKR